ncbi:MAG: HEPN domain-containing protein [Candidatus Woesearchaeota archaeon]|nr:HEPN domain-containing protein [Candidatus Woesearchaeota archaeon]
MNTADWINTAKRDLRVAKYTLKGGLYEAAAFFAQQTAEKALKAVLLSKGSELVKTHDVVRLAQWCGAPQEIVLASALLNPAYVSTRYPDSFVKLVIAREARALVSAAMEVLAWSKKNC